LEEDLGLKAALWRNTRPALIYSIGNYIVQGSYDPMRWGL